MKWPLLLITFLALQLTWHEYYERGEKRFGRGEYAACIEDMRQAVAEKPEPRKNQFTRAVQKIEYKPYYYLALSHHALGDLPRAFTYAQQAYDGEVVRDNPALQSDLAPILEEYRAEVQALHGQITREEELIAERSRLIGLLLQGETEQVKAALRRIEDPERFRDIQMYLDLGDDVRDQLNDTQRDVVERIVSWLDQGDVVKARALFDGVSAMLSPDAVRDLTARIEEAEALIPEPPAAQPEEASEQAGEPVIDPEEINKYRRDLAAVEEQKQSLDQQVTFMTEQNRELRRELDRKRAEPTGPDLSEYPPGVFLEIEPEGKGIRFEGHAMSPAPIVSWRLTFNGSPITLDERAVSREGANMVFAHHMPVEDYGTHEIGLEIEDSLGRSAAVVEPFTLVRPWYLDQRIWWSLAGLLVIVFAARFLLFVSRRRRAMLRHFNP
jgi:tetratricopeptide (TPR) repeat protein